MALEIDEEWIREKVQLEHKNLDDVRSLCLPGSVEEKITQLGNSLKRFARLKCLDLSRNDLENLDGLQHLKMLEKLNLYYNSISSLQELFKLRFNQRLQELDLRLNPVAGSDANYRLFLIHMLPRLRKLDDRPVRDNERRAALMQFSTEVATELSPKYLEDEVAATQTINKPLSRSNLVQSVGRGPAQDLEALIGEVERTNGDLTKPRPITGSNENYPSYEDYAPSAVRQMDRQRVNNYEDYRTTHEDKESDEYLETIESKYPHLASLANSLQQTTKDKRNRKLTEENIEIHNRETIAPHGFFTPAPTNNDRNQPAVPHIHTTNLKRDTREDITIPSTIPYDCSMDRLKRLGENAPSFEQNLTVDQGEAVRVICSIADKYWNGVNSLEKNPKALKALTSLLQQISMTAPDRSVVGSEVEDESKMKSALVRSQRDVVSNSLFILFKVQ
ncbi:DgyrCDS66 [Dimorphilus gyrociliatus]|uniref:Centrosomal protein of 72 kDa n=1 Tax=Dimorphilus gyrociliatus TaxID=2664684 RepID=A0A7I8V682_9ANNE|nr:DgyrCDS66 [Dimorphilus gyrociliatus]